MSGEANGIEKLGRYEILEELGRGAMGIVYKATDPSLGRTVVLKTLRRDAILPSELDEILERFNREAKAAGRLSHPGIVSVHDVGTDEVTREPFLAMEYVKGATLHALVSAGVPLPPKQVVEMVAEVAEALDYAHRAGIIHRDIKPANLFLGEDNRVKIGDFGIARVDGSTLTATGQALGSPSYMSPEQLEGKAVDGRSDLFSLGVVAYQLLTRKLPFRGQGFATISYKIVNQAPKPPIELNPSLPPVLSASVMKALEKDPGQRFATGREMAAVFRAAMKEAAPPKPAGPPPDDEGETTERKIDKAPRMIPIHNLLIGILGVAVLAFGIILAGLFLWLKPSVTAPAKPFDKVAMELLSKRRYRDLRTLATERLRENPDDAEAKGYLKLANQALALKHESLPTKTVPAAGPCTLDIRLTAYYSGKLKVSVDGVPVITRSFHARAVVVFGHVIPGSVQPASLRISTIIRSGHRKLTIEVTSRSGRTKSTKELRHRFPDKGTTRLKIEAHGGREFSLDVEDLDSGKKSGT